ncbi:carbohydrate-binding module family 50 protein [Hypoxylon sp. CI-4A]|nr:carbohydrate-binding module family 50 protein [Hypoxylon sp. CI-4A]
MKHSLKWVLPIILSISLKGVLAQDACPKGPTFPKTVANCNAWYTVPKDKNEDCSTIEAKFHITSEQFLSWNPEISKDCLSNFWQGYAYCVGVGTKALTCSSSSASPTKPSSFSISNRTSSYLATHSLPHTVSGSWNSTITAANATYSTRFPVTGYNLTSRSIDTAWPPSKTQAGQPSYCNSWHLVSGGETCESISRQARISLDQLNQWNPGLGTNCTHLFVDWWVCVGAQPQTSATWPWSTVETDTSIPAPTAWTSKTHPSVNSNFTAVPTQTGIPRSCQAYYQAKRNDTCIDVLAEYTYISKEQFFKWNPALNGTCNGLRPGYWYCVADFGTDLPMPPTLTIAPSPTASGQPSNCTTWYYSTVNDDCDAVVLQFGTFSKDDFISWNPSVWSDCSNFQENEYYCVGVLGTPTSRTSAIPITTTVDGVPNSIPGVDASIQASPTKSLSKIIHMYPAKDNKVR